MTDGRRTNPAFGYGFDPQPQATQPGICRGICRGERYRDDPPAKFGTTPDGVRTIWCPCCNSQLRLARPGEAGFSPETPMRLAALDPSVSGNARLYVDPFCRYDVIRIEEIVPADQVKA